MWVGIQIATQRRMTWKGHVRNWIIGRQHKAKTCSNQRGTFSKLPNKQMKVCQVGNAFGSKHINKCPLQVRSCQVQCWCSTVTIHGSVFLTFCFKLVFKKELGSRKFDYWVSWTLLAFWFLHLVWVLYVSPRKDKKRECCWEKYIGA